MRKLTLLCLLLLPSLAAAQFTTVTGTVTDPNGVPYANGTITALLVLTGVTPTLNGQSFTMTGASGLSAAGSFTMQLADNNVMVPSGLQWLFTVCSGAGTIQPAGGTGPQCFTPAAITITGASQSITAQLTAVAPALTTIGGLCAACLPKNNPTVTGTTFTLPNTENFLPTTGSTLIWNMGATGNGNTFQLRVPTTSLGTPNITFSGGSFGLQGGGAAAGTSTVGGGGGGLKIGDFITGVGGLTSQGGATFPGVPVMFAGSLLTGRTTALGTTTILASPAFNATFRITASAYCTTTSASATATITLTYTDVSSTVQTVTGTGATCTTLGPASFQQISIPLARVKANTNFQWAIAIANTPTYDATVLIEGITFN